MKNIGHSIRGRSQGVPKYVMAPMYRAHARMGAAKNYKWPAVAAQTARSRCKVLSIQCVCYFRPGLALPKAKDYNTWRWRQSHY